MDFITNETIRYCYDFAVYAWENSSQSKKQYGTEEIRARNEFVADQLTDKLAECLFKAIIEEHYSNIQVQLDFSHYTDPLHTDNGDVNMYIDRNLLPVRIDIKGSSHRAQWLLVEEHKFKDLKTGAPMADCYIMVRFSENMPVSRILRNNPERILSIPAISGEITGWAYHHDFFSSKDNQEWFVYNKGDRPLKRKVLPYASNRVNDLNHLHNYINKRIRTQGFTEADIYLSVPLDAKKNMGLPINWLKTDLNVLFHQAPSRV
ncbi:hypothetical protein [Domibacillus iocasae]|uniref:Uncharacterized protein n=1 Tax=Domibacillus iocasae TaxID=1714016 RepID=A0A1E7DJW9_9BACI|nr:hypothetical protein [Domibacillus iocasae]OES43344.1 hypothetical protein BA724_13925 [Domibacillus iocasae]